jgi:hypothetical protein
MAGNKWLPAALAAGVCLGSLALDQSAVAASLTSPSPTVIAGNSITLTLNDTISRDDFIAGIDLLITFDHSLLTLVSVVDGTDLPDFGPILFNAANGLIDIPETDLDASGSGSVVLLTFTAKMSDPTTSTIVTAQTSSKALGVDEEYQLAATSSTVNITAAPVTPPATLPEPGTVVLLLAPLLAAASLKLRARP